MHVVENRLICHACPFHTVLYCQETVVRLVQNQEEEYGVDKHAIHEIAYQCHADDQAHQVRHNCWWIYRETCETSIENSKLLA